MLLSANMIRELPDITNPLGTRKENVLSIRDQIQSQSQTISGLIRENWDRGTCIFCTSHFFPENQKLLQEKGYVEVDVTVLSMSNPPTSKYRIRWRRAPEGDALRLPASRSP